MLVLVQDIFLRKQNVFGSDAQTMWKDISLNRQRQVAQNQKGGRGGRERKEVTETSTSVRKQKMK